MTASFVDKIILYALGVVMNILVYSREEDIAYLLVGAIILGISQLICGMDRYNIEGIIYIVFIIFCYWQPIIIAFVGICVYSMIYKYYSKQKVLISYMAIFLLLSIYPIVILGIFEQVLAMIIVGLAVCLAWKSSLIEKSKGMLKKLRDDSTENEQSLSEKNSYLLNKIENEVHIATLKERNRIAREIHDNVGHILSRTILQLGAVMAVEKDSNTKNMLEPIKVSLDEAMNSIRESVHDLYKDSFDLREAVKSLSLELSGYEVQLEYDMSKKVNKEIKYSFVTILKEAINNIIKYSNGDRVYIALRELDGYYQMVIEDNGVVEKKDSYTESGMGLDNMEERIRRLSGVITFSTQNGFRIFISVPKN